MNNHKNSTNIASKTFAAKVNDVELMLSGLKSHQEDLSKRGVDEEFIKNLEQVKKEVIQLNNEQEKLKAELKSKTSKLRDSLNQMNKLYSESKKRVKLDIPLSMWLEFGISDKR